MTDLLNLSTEQLRRIADIKEKMDSLQYELSRVLGGRAPGKRVVRISAAGRARIAEAQRRRWAEYNSGRTVKSIAARGASKPRRALSPAAKAKIAAAARARWAKAKAAGKSRL
ncbi:MAG TPA: hypothetical protein VMF08_17975 [Candidatus Sulfotelmatobacter sp.]|nr:hypothetical protein [Candidatus Sulfotelmatobacter sp.]